MKKIILFDFDGVIENNYEMHFEASQKQYTDLTREEHRKFFEGNVHVEREKFAHRHTGYDARTPFSEAKKTTVMNPDVKRIVLDLAYKFTLGIVTSAREDGILGYLSYNEIPDAFAFVYGLDAGKLKTDKFQKVFAEYSVGPDECIFITDTLGDVLEGHEAGIDVVALDVGYHERERLQKGNPEYIISSLSELIDIVKAT
jgi:HAD superfamily hydrolase (TIGR01509 family)